MATKGKVKEAMRILAADGWVIVAQKGSHRQYKHATKKGRVTVNGKPNDDLPPKLWDSVMRQAGLK